MQYHLTFGQRYAREQHPVLSNAHPDGYYVVEADDLEAARLLVISHLGEAWSFLNEPAPDDHEYYPRGVIGHINEHGITELTEQGSKQ